MKKIIVDLCKKKGVDWANDQVTQFRKKKDLNAFSNTLVALLQLVLRGCSCALSIGAFVVGVRTFVLQAIIVLGIIALFAITAFIIL